MKTIEWERMALLEGGVKYPCTTNVKLAQLSYDQWLLILKLGVVFWPDDSHIVC